MDSPLTPQQEIVDIGRRLDSRRLIAGSDGNISVRLTDSTILITPSGTSKGRLDPKNLITVDLQGKKISGDGSPSSEMAMHLFVYQQRPDVRACVHAHPPFATAFAVAGRPLDFECLPEVVLFVGAVPLTEYAPPGTSAVPRSIEPFVAAHNAFLLRNHGLLTIGRTLEEAYNRHETVEQYARICHLALQLGNINRIPDDDHQRLVNMRRQLENALSPSR